MNDFIPIVDIEFIKKQNNPLLNTHKLEIYDINSTSKIIEMRSENMIKARKRLINIKNAEIQSDKERSKTLEIEVKGLITNETELSQNISKINTLLSQAIEIEKPYLTNILDSLEDKKKNIDKNIIENKKELNLCKKVWPKNIFKYQIQPILNDIEKIKEKTKMLQEFGKENYPIINLDFLAKKKISDKPYTFSIGSFHEQHDISCHLYMPVFSIYQYNNPIFGVLNPERWGYAHKFNESKYITFPMHINYDPGFTRGGLKISPELPEFIYKKIAQETYEDKLQFKKYPRTGYEYDRLKEHFLLHTYIKSQFNSVIPTNTKKRINDAKKIFEEEIYIVSETDNWDIKKSKAELHSSDPIVIGVNRDLELAFFIDSFYETNLERLILGTHVGTAPQN